MSSSGARYQKINIGTSQGLDAHRPLESLGVDASSQTIPETLGRDLISISCCWSLVRSMLGYHSHPLQSIATTKRPHTETEETLENLISSASENIAGANFRSMKVIYPDATTLDTIPLSPTSPPPYIPSNNGRASATLSCIIQPRTPLSYQHQISVL